MTKPSNENDLLRRITSNPDVFGGKPTIRNRRLAVEHVLGMLAAGDTPDIVLQGYPWLEPDDIRACLVYARRLVGHERIDLRTQGSSEAELQQTFMADSSPTATGTSG